MTEDVREITAALEQSAFSVEHVRFVPTDLEMAFATLIPTAAAGAAGQGAASPADATPGGAEWTPSL